MSELDQSTTSDAPESGPKELREALKRREEAIEALESQVQELTNAARAQQFDLAGVPDNKAGQAFRQAYDGVLEQDAIAAELADWGIAQPAAQEQPAPEPAPVVSDIERQAMAQVAGARTTAPTSTGQEAVLESLQQMEASGEFTLKDLESTLRNAGMLTEGY